MPFTPVELTPARRRAARIIALAADAVQLGLFPLFGEGFASPLDDALDVVVAGVLIRLLGFHWPLLPALVAELVPGLDLAPTWTAAVMMITGGKRTVWVAVAVLALLVAAAAYFLWRK